MKISLRRQGITIRTFEITGDKASIGSAAEAEIRIEDPYLAGHVADLVRDARGWRIVDAGRSLEGVTRAGRRVEDEPLSSGETYSIGGFELVAEGVPGNTPTSHSTLASGARRPTDEGVAATVIEPLPPSSHAPIPGTVVEPMPRRMAEVPATVMEPMPPRGAVPATVMEPMPPRPASLNRAPEAPPVQSAPVMQQAAVAPPRKSQRRKILVLLVIIVLLLLLAVVKESTRKKEEIPVATKSVKPAVAVETRTVAPENKAPVSAPKPPPDSELARTLQVDALLDRWDQKLASSPDAALQSRFVQTALEAAMVHAANGNPEKAKALAQRAMKFITSGSAEEKIARSFS